MSLFIGYNWSQNQQEKTIIYQEEKIDDLK